MDDKINNKRFLSVFGLKGALKKEAPAPGVLIPSVGQPKKTPTKKKKFLSAQLRGRPFSTQKDRVIFLPVFGLKEILNEAAPAPGYLILGVQQPKSQANKNCKVLSRPVSLSAPTRMGAYSCLRLG